MARLRKAGAIFTPRLERLEDRVTPTTLPPGFTETLVTTNSNLVVADGHGVLADRPALGAGASRPGQAGPGGRHHPHGA